MPPLNIRAAGQRFSPSIFFLRREFESAEVAREAFRADSISQRFMLLEFISRLLYFVLLVFLFRAAYRYLFGRASQKRKSPPNVPPGRSPTISGHMVKDPVCGMYIDEQTALSLERKGQSFYFCSEECRKKYLASRA